MFFDPTLRSETKVDPLSLPAFIAWLERQPGEQTYNFSDCNGACLLCQYLTAAGLDYADNYRGLFDRPETRTAVAAVLPNTFGAALKRARALVN